MNNVIDNLIEAGYGIYYTVDLEGKTLVQNDEELYHVSTITKCEDGKCKLGLEIHLDNYSEYNSFDGISLYSWKQGEGFSKIGNYKLSIGEPIMKGKVLNLDITI